MFFRYLSCLSAFKVLMVPLVIPLVSMAPVVMKEARKEARLSDKTAEEGRLFHCMIAKRKNEYL